MTPTKTLFSFKGRIGPSTFLPLTFGLLILISLTKNLFEPPINADGLIPAIPYYIYTILFSWVILSLHIKRWHDRNRPGWWILVHILTAITFSWSLQIMVDLSNEIAQFPYILSLIVFGVSLMGLIWYFFEIGIMSGTPGPNKYGHDPTQPAGTEDQP